MRKYIFSFIFGAFFWACGSVVFSQSKATELLDKVVAKYNASKGISARFSIENKNAQNQVSGRTSGTLKMQGQCFTLKSQDMMIWYDGKNQWAFMPSSNEVNLSIPSRDEIQEVNPYMILKSYKKEFKSLYKGKSNGLERVELIPLQKNVGIKNILLEIDVTRLYPVSIVVFNSNKTSLNIHVTEYQTGLNFKNSEFVFDERQFPEAEIIDLR